MPGEPTIEFLQSIRNEKLSNADRAVAALWFLASHEIADTASASQLGRLMESAGYARQNVSHLNKKLKADLRTTRRSNGSFCVRVDACDDLRSAYAPFIHRSAPKDSGIIVPTELTAGTRGYIKSIAWQLNGSYEFGHYDCCAVMCRRLVETLIIEAYEENGWVEDIKQPDGNYPMLGRLISAINTGKRIHLGREAKAALSDIKKLGDRSAHNRRYQTRKSDLDGIRQGFRVATEELLHIANLV